MKIRTKILLLFILGTIMPFLISFVFIERGFFSRYNADSKLRTLQDATLVASRIDDHLNWIMESSSMVLKSIPFENLTKDQFAPILYIPCRQLDFVTQVALFDSKGKEVVPAYVPTKEEAQSLGKPFVTQEERKRFFENVPLSAALEASLAMGPVYLSDSGSPRVVLAAAFDSLYEQKKVVAIGISLESLCDVLYFGADDKVKESILLNEKGHPLCGLDSYFNWKEISNYPQIEKLHSGDVKPYHDDNDEYFAVKVSIPLAHWALFHKHSISSVFMEYKELRNKLLIWIVMCVIGSILGVLLLSGRITTPILQLEKAVGRVEKGDYSKAIEVLGNDEFTALAMAFNKMVKELEEWNLEMNNRVDEKTRELRLAHEQIVRTQKLAALSELGAGVAHEINNPLTAVVGNAQLIMSEFESDSPNYSIARDIVDNARRVAEVVDALLRFSQNQWGITMQPVLLEDILIRSVDFYIERFKEKQIEIVWRHREILYIQGIERDLQLVCTSILDNAIKALPLGGRLWFDIKTIEGGAVMLAVEDTGCGMTYEQRLKSADPFYSSEPNKSRGLGLTLVQRIVDEHEATMTIESKEGTGTRISIFFPGESVISRK